MKRHLLLCAALSAGAFVFTHAAYAADITATGAWVRWLPSGLPAAGYVTLTNKGDKDVDVVSAQSPDYGSAMLHESVHNGSTDKMIMVDQLKVPAHGTVSFAPGGYHLMLEKATHKIVPGDTVHVQLGFSDGTSIDVPMKVSPPDRTH